MAAIVEEELGTISGDETGLQRGYIVANAESEIEALDATRQHITAQGELHWPPIVDDASPTYRRDENKSFYLHNIAIAEVEMVVRTTPGVGLFKTIANYGFRATCPLVEWESRTTQVRVYSSLEKVVAFKHPRASLANRPEPDYEGAIEVEDRRPNGTDKLMPQRTVTVLWHPPAGFITDLWQEETRGLVGLTNDNPIFGAQYAQELLMTDIQTTIIDRRNELHEVRLTMQYSEQNRRAVNIGGIQISIGQIPGHHYVWADKEGEEDPSSSVFIPRFNWAFIERLYDTGDFTKVFQQDGTGTNVALGCPGFPRPGP